MVGPPSVGTSATLQRTTDTTSPKSTSALALAVPGVQRRGSVAAAAAATATGDYCSCATFARSRAWRISSALMTCWIS